ncbi:hypothetical protein GGI22_007583, partial [Coemansia erecta]
MLRALAPALPRVRAYTTKGDITNDKRTGKDNNPTSPSSGVKKIVPTASKRSKGAMSMSGIRIILGMFRYVWPKGDWATKSRVLAALGLMLGSKLLNVQ